jgi:uncharacterized protein YijF (DUF1287 family)
MLLLGASFAAVPGDPAAEPKLLAVHALAGAPAVAGNADIVAAAQAQVGVTLRYDPAYRSLKYPGGDVPATLGVCTDVIVRALRTARALDLQQLVHEDLAANWDEYPHQRRWNLAKPDPNIDHRRVPNLMVYLQRAGYGRRPARDAATYLPGDIVAWDLGRGILHIGIIGDLRTAAGVPLVIHNIGAGAREEDILFRYTIIGQYRLPAARVAAD